MHTLHCKTCEVDWTAAEGHRCWACGGLGAHGGIQLPARFLNHIPAPMPRHLSLEQHHELAAGDAPGFMERGV